VTDDRSRRLFLIVAVAGISVLFVAMIQPFILTLLLAAIAANLLRPVYRFALRAVGNRPPWASALTILALLLIFVGPTAVLLGVVAQQTLELTKDIGEVVRPLVENPESLRAQLARVPGIDRLEPFAPQIAERAAQLIGMVGGFLLGGLGAVTGSAAAYLLNFLLWLYALFFFLSDGPAYLQTVLRYLPLSDAENARLMERFQSVSAAAIRGTVFIGAIQGSINGFAFWLVGLPAPAFWGAVMILASVVPGVGAMIIWAPAVVWLAVTHRMSQAIALVVICGGISGTVDNLLRPRLVGRDARMPDLLILLSTLGGLGYFGVLGFVVGPVVAALFLTLWEIFRDVSSPVERHGVKV